MIAIDIPILAKTPATGSRAAHTAEAIKRRDQRAAVRGALVLKKPPPLPLVVTFVRVSPRPIDDEVLPDAFNVIRHEVALWLGVDVDSLKVRWRYEQEHSRKGKDAPAMKGTRIRIEAMTSSTATADALMAVFGLKRGME